MLLFSGILIISLFPQGLAGQKFYPDDPIAEDRDNLDIPPVEEVWISDYYDFIEEICTTGKIKVDRIIKKFIIPKELKSEFLINLKAMNITASSLFPGVDGLGKSVKQFVDYDSKLRENLIRKLLEF